MVYETRPVGNMGGRNDGTTDTLKDEPRGVIHLYVTDVRNKAMERDKWIKSG